LIGELFLIDQLQLIDHLYLTDYFRCVAAGAVFLGHYLSDKISERHVTFGAGGLFILFGVFSIVEIAFGNGPAFSSSEAPLTQP
jgi:hypothetical protein